MRGRASDRSTYHCLSRRFWALDGLRTDGGTKLKQVHVRQPERSNRKLSRGRSVNKGED
jgi:hypothetical protein